MSAITAADILTAYSTSDALRLAAEAWRAGNDAGDGYEPDEDVAGLDPEISGDGFDVYRISDDEVIVVADANGPWAVRVSD